MNSIAVPDRSAATDCLAVMWAAQWWPMLTAVLIKAVVAGLLASVACGLGALPLLLRRFDPAKHTAIGYGLAGGLMFAASVYNLLLPSLRSMTQLTLTLGEVVPVLVGLLLGSAFLATADRYLPHDAGDDGRWKSWGGRTGVLIFLTMSVHSIPEGVAVGTGYATGALEQYNPQLGSYIALAIAIHNIPEGLAVAIPLRTAGAGIGKCFFAAFLTSLPQPIAAVPAVLAAWFFEPLMPVLMGFAAGAMIFLVVLELIPEALETGKPVKIAWSFMAGFCLMLLIQVAL
ncbi:MAG: ZIP family metal transporter [Phycisphaeraceae bacterium]